MSVVPRPSGERILRRWAFPLAAVLCATVIAAAQRDSSTPIFSTGTAAVVVDVIVRDRDHRPVTGLTADDFEVFEDGVRQTITSFDVVTRPISPNNATPVPPQPLSTVAPKLPTDSPPAIVAFVFEQLSADARRIAERAATALIRSDLARSDFAGVFYLDRALHPLVPYTNDKAALQKGIRKVSLRPGYPLEFTGLVPGAEHTSSKAGEASQTTRHDSPFVRAHATFDALERLVDSLAALPGRKAVVLFSEGFAMMQPQEKSIAEDMAAVGLPSPGGSGGSADPLRTWLHDNRREAFFKVLERANRAHVAFYTFDARGLRVDSPFANKKCPTCPAYVGLKILADETGGAFVENTNDLSTPVSRVLADSRQYYLLGYTPTRAALDDTYREIRVRVRRPNVKILARKGYRATVQPDPQVRSYEVAPLLTLNSGSSPSGFPMRVGTLAFPEAARPGRTAIVAQVPGAGLTWQQDATGRSAVVTVLARVVDDEGETLKYASERFELRASAQDQTGEVLFYKEADLPVGVHSLEVAAVDAHSHAATVRRATVEVPKTERKAALLVSTPFIVRTADRIAGDRLHEGALRFGDWLLVPNLGDALPPGSELSFAFAIDAKSDGELQATATLLTSGEPVVSAALELPQPDRDGRVLYIGRIPLGLLAPGTPQLSVVVTNGKAAVQRLVTFQIAGGQTP